jgi:glyoxylase-like metal-dependent hydrolase (beta-lactamase superfamily II)
VVNSHLHWDHCGWNTILTQGVPRPAFPRAVYYTRRGEWEHAHRRHPRDSVAYIDANYDPLVDAGRMRLIDADTEVAPGVWLRLAPGHTPDMMVITASVGGPDLLLPDGLVPTAAHVTPTWVAAFDLDPIQSIDSKLHWLGEAARGEWICAFAHDPPSRASRIAFARIAAMQATKDRPTWKTLLAFAIIYFVWGSTPGPRAPGRDGRSGGADEPFAAPRRDAHRQRGRGGADRCIDELVDLFGAHAQAAVAVFQSHELGSADARRRDIPDTRGGSPGRVS